MRIKKIHYNLVITFLTLIWTTPATALESIPIPPQTNATWVSKSSIHNGHQTAIQKIESRSNVDSVIQFYRKAWESSQLEPSYMESVNGDWKMISRIEDDHQWVVQIRSKMNRPGSEGFISSMALHRFHGSYNAQHATLVPQLPGGEVLSVTESDTPTKAITQVQLFNGRAQSIAGRAKQYIAAQGWELQDEFDHKSSVAQRYARSGRQLDVASVNVSPGKTLLFVNEILHEN